MRQGRNNLPTADPLARFRARLRLPLIAAPMFLVSGVELVVAACRNGVIGSFPTVNCRETEQLDGWLSEIERRLQADADASGRAAAPICPNLIVHRSNARLAQDLQVLLRHRPEIVITSVGSPAPTLRFSWPRDQLSCAGRTVLRIATSPHTMSSISGRQHEYFGR